MANIENSNKVLIEGLVYLLRDEVSGWSTNSEHGVPNVWGKNVPESVEEEFPRGTVDSFSGNDFELDVDMNVRLREVSVKFVVFAKSSGPVEDLIHSVGDAVEEHWDEDDPRDGEPYIGDWSLRESDGFTELNESGEQEGDLRYSRSMDYIFETVRKNN